MNPADRIQLIRRSLRVFACGWLSFILVIGIIPALYAFFAGGRTPTSLQHEWNPAANYLFIGRFLAVISLSISVLAAGILFVQVMW